MLCSLYLFQGDSDGAEAQVSEAAARAPAAQDNQPHSEAEGCVRLRRHLAQERLQHPPRLHTLSGAIKYRNRIISGIISGKWLMDI